MSFQGTNPATSEFQGLDRLCMCPIGLFILYEEKHVSLQDKHLCQKQEDLDMVSLWELSFWKEYFCSKTDYSDNLKKHMDSAKENHLC